MSTPEVDSAGGMREVKSAARTVDVLEYLAARQNQPVRLRELCTALGTPKSSLYALLRTLIARGWVATDASGTLYTIGIRALLAGTAYLDADPYLRILRPHLDALNEELDETIHLGRLDGHDVIYLATRDSSQYLRPHSRVGRRLPAHSTALGKAVLAAGNAALPPTLEVLTPHTLASHDALEADLEATRRRGYAVDAEESALGLRCFGFALRYSDPPTDAVSCSIPIARLTPRSQDKIIHALQRAVREMETAVAGDPSVR